MQKHTMKSASVSGYECTQFSECYSATNIQHTENLLYFALPKH
jgi:hypothetical protein